MSQQHRCGAEHCPAIDEARFAICREADLPVIREVSQMQGEVVMGVSTVAYATDVRPSVRFITKGPISHLPGLWPRKPQLP
jgi:hypothetical protein